MPDSQGNQHAGVQTPRHVFFYTGGFLRQRRLRRILSLAGYHLRLGWPDSGDLVGVWGQSRHSWRGEAVAARSGARLLRIEDAFLRSLHPGRTGEPPLGLMLDHSGVHFDARRPSDLETLLRTHPLRDAQLLKRASAAIARMREAHLSKYAATRIDLPLPEAGFVLVIDQTRGDASLKACGADQARFDEMLDRARQRHPGAQILIKTHPETAAGLRPGHYGPEHKSAGVRLWHENISPWQLLDRAAAVYTVSSQLGFEAILAGHRPQVFGTPFYAGWGLSEDHCPLPGRGRALSTEQLFAAAMILSPFWYDPYRDRLCEIEDVLCSLEAQSHAWRQDQAGWVASGMRLWKRPHLQRFFGGAKPLLFENDPTRAEARATRTGRGHMAWAGKAKSNETRIEDGFLRSKGLGAALITPLSLVCDDLGIYYDPSRPSRLENLITTRARSMRPDQTARSMALIERLIHAGLSKYNLRDPLPPLPAGPKILVPGQVQDDASILLGCGGVRSNRALLESVRAANPGAVLIYKPHPDVVAGLRSGHVDNADRWADLVLERADMGALLPHMDEVWTLTSLTGFEALLRGCKVTCLGAPFYAGWGLTCDQGDVPARRMSGPEPTLTALAHATLIDYPRYLDPLTGLPCPVEVIIERLQTGPLPRPGPFNRSLSKLQGLLASRAHLWRD